MRSLARPDLEKPGEPSPQVQVGWGFRGGAGTLLVHGGAGRQAGAGPPQIHGEAGSLGWGLFTGRGGASQVTEGWVGTHRSKARLGGAGPAAAALAAVATV